jgi:FixJ family two-component response regulator
VIAGPPRSGLTRQSMRMNEAEKEFDAPRERDGLEQIVAGASIKEAAITPENSPRAIEPYRTRIIQKLGARNAADLVRIVLGRGGR